jgi:hypothetical protein
MEPRSLTDPGKNEASENVNRSIHAQGEVRHPV